MKRVFKVLLVLLVFSVIFLPLNVKAETIADLKNKLQIAEEKEKKHSDDIKLTEEEISRTKTDISKTYVDIENILKEIPRLEDEIKELEKTIKEKDLETKELMKSLQITMGDSFYLEYIFGADSIRDFIYRISVTEQITKYNADLTKEMNKSIEENNKKKKELAEKQIELTNKQDLLVKQLDSLGSRKNELYELSRAVLDEIKTTRDVIKMYEDAGCKEYEDLKVCAAKLILPDTDFRRPLYNGYMSSEYGNRVYYYYGKEIKDFHEGIDLTNGLGNNAKIYSVANGKVAAIFEDRDSRGNYIAGGLQLVIHHVVDGRAYSSSYAHLSRVLVSVGDIVTSDTVVAMMGSTGQSTGPHLHIAISYDFRYTDKESKDYYWYTSRCFNPVTVLNIPRLLVGWTGR